MDRRTFFGAVGAGAALLVLPKALQAEEPRLGLWYAHWVEGPDSALEQTMVAYSAEDAHAQFRQRHPSYPQPELSDWYEVDEDEVFNVIEDATPDRRGRVELTPMPPDVKMVFRHHRYSPDGRLTPVRESSLTSRQIVEFFGRGEPFEVA